MLPKRMLPGPSQAPYEGCAESGKPKRGQVMHRMRVVKLLV